MNTLKTVFEKLFKEETQLAKHEVELGLVDDAKKLQGDLNNTISTYERKWEMLKKSKIELDDLRTKAENLGFDIKEIADKIIKAEKELGITGNGLSIKEEAQKDIDWIIKKDLAR
jgi:undecaprenyl pyrophosphate synthase